MKEKLTYIIVSLVVGVICGWLIGSQQEVQIIENVRYVERPATNIQIDSPRLYRSKPIDWPKLQSLPRLQLCDTIRETVVVPADTAAIISDYLQCREYDLDFSTDTTGVYKVNAIVEANRLTSASATIIPLQREVEQTVVKVRQFRPYVGGSLSIGVKPGASLEVGVLLKDHHFPKVGYQRLGNENYITAGYGYLF
ncbi:MAG: hypothetical protein IKA07_06530 [Alistipes sp.]|nr:hypothetical protein [Alistipes sp.]